MESTNQILWDEREISNQLAKFVRILDEKRFDDLDEIFSENVVFDYADGVERQGLSEMKKIITGFLSNCGPTQHLLGSLLVEAYGSTAKSRVYIQARHQGAGDNSNFFFDACGEFIDEWECTTEKGWVIVKRVIKSMLKQGDIRALGLPQK